MGARVSLSMLIMLSSDRICEFKSQSATYVGAFSISQLELYSFLFHF